MTAFMTVYNTMVSDGDITQSPHTGLFQPSALLGHSGMDFNLSLGAVALYLWQLFGVIKFSGTTIKVEQKPTKTAWPAIALVGVSCAFVVFSFLLYQGYTYGQQAVRSIEEQDIIKAREYFESQNMIRIQHLLRPICTA